MSHLHALQIKTLPATNTKGTRIKIISLRHGNSKTINYDHTFNNSYDVAVDYLSKNGVNILHHSSPEFGALSNSYIASTELQKKFNAGGLKC